jgi:hypothetical protein
MHPTIYFQKMPDILISVASFFRKCRVGLIFIPLGSLSLVKYPVLYIGSQFFQLLGRAYCSRVKPACDMSFGGGARRRKTVGRVHLS